MNLASVCMRQERCCTCNLMIVFKKLFSVTWYCLKWNNGNKKTKENKVKSWQDVQVNLLLGVLLQYLHLQLMCERGHGNQMNALWTAGIGGWLISATCPWLGFVRKQNLQHIISRIVCGPQFTAAPFYRNAYISPTYKRWTEENITPAAKRHFNGHYLFLTCWPECLVTSRRFCVRPVNTSFN